MVSRTSARLSASQARIGSYASKVGFQIGSFSRRRSLANPIVGVCDVAIAPMILAMIALLLGVKLLHVGSHHPYANRWQPSRAILSEAIGAFSSWITPVDFWRSYRRWAGAPDR